MTVRSYPWENQNSTETDFGHLFGALHAPGVVGSPGSLNLSASLAGGLVVRFAAGMAICDGFVMEVDGAGEDVNVGPADPAVRVDRIVARRDPTLNVFTLYHKKGSQGSLVPPALTRTRDGAYDVALYQVKIGAGAAGLALDALVDERDWASRDIRHWRTADRPDSGDGTQYLTGWNLDTGRLEFWDGSGWRYFMDQRDATAPVTAFGGAIAGTTPAVGARLVQRTGTVTITADGSGSGAVSWPAFGQSLTGIQVTLAYPGTGATGPVEAEWLPTNPAPTLGGCRVALLDRDRNTVNTGTWTATVTVTGVD